MSIWRVEIQHGPEGEQNYAWVYDGKEMIGTFKTHRANQIVDAMNRRPEPSAPSPAGVEVVAWQWRKKPWAGSADGSAKWSDWQNGRAADAAKFEPADYEERALVPAASLDQATRRAEEAARREAAWEETRLANANLRNENGALRGRCSALEQALEDEREACAKIAETLPFTAEHHPTRIAKAIRAREALSSTARRHLPPPPSPSEEQ